ACAAGLATLDIYRRDGLFERARALSPRFQDAMFSLKGLPHVTDIRGYGLFAAFDLESDGKPGHRGFVLQKQLFDNGVNLKTTGDTCIVAPPFIAAEGDIDEIAAILRRTLASG
ncbi:MAG: aminotransferase class III-fold pyridoxal phosphate-dependent enzyme, partial [Proteobacteria bacterium]|nr:aminotransferase class III-fold pyridoxal phosphate-dependent enzyme [Pseudomonadota bacterium]